MKQALYSGSKRNSIGSTVQDMPHSLSFRSHIRDPMNLEILGLSLYSATASHCTRLRHEPSVNMSRESVYVHSNKRILLEVLV